ncbi:MAG: L-aspartate oxidase [bacterium]
MIHNYLVSFNTKDLPYISTDILIIGSGIAALCAAIEAAKYGNVIVATKANLKDCNTELAQGGIAVVLNEKDSIESHIKDTLEIGCGLCNKKSVEILVNEGPVKVKKLIHWGTNFDMQDKKLNFTQEAGHNQKRVIHAKGDATGKEVERVLVEKIKKCQQIKILENTFVIDLLHYEKICYGAIIFKDKKKMLIKAKKTILSTGGIGQIYRESTNSPVITGDGMAMAYRSGANLLDMEFVQFHPTTLYIAGASRILISEAVRGEGGILKNKYGERFMPSYHPKAELAPRDITSRAILEEMKKTNDTQVYLDLTSFKKQFFQKRFPYISKVCASFNINIEKDFIPVCPTAHYMIGGIKTDFYGKTNIENLFACGEVSCNGIHGANRLASNSLLEGLVFGERTGSMAGSNLKRNIKINFSISLKLEKYKKINLEDLKNSLKSLMWKNVGIEKEKKILEQAEKKINFWTNYVLNMELKNQQGWELQNMLTISSLIQKAAYIREETRGVHYRKDFSKKNDEKWLIHLQQNKELKIRKEKICF